MAPLPAGVEFNFPESLSAPGGGGGGGGGAGAAAGIGGGGGSLFALKHQRRQSLSNGLLGSEGGGAVPSGAGAASSSPIGGMVGGTVKRPPALKIAAPTGAGPAAAGSSSVAAAAAATDVGSHSHNVPGAGVAPQFFAEGKAVTKLLRGGGAHAGPEGGHPMVAVAAAAAPGSPDYNPNLDYYREINDADSLCGTPPSISISALNREFDALLPLGPLSPSPLSPSILTVCTNGLRDFEFHEGGASPSEGVAKSGEDGGPDIWVNTYNNLPDMRECSSPYLATCDSPGGLPTAS